MEIFDFPGRIVGLESFEELLAAAHRLTDLGHFRLRIKRLPPERQTIEQLLAMKPGDFIELERQPKIQASVDGVPVFECQYGTHNSKYAIRIDKSLRGNDMNWLGERHGG